ncbi:unnamed protein product [marine sediment metagenome]|uniref:Uncharacterized protein n=1 Tax=marine sediment metagenome TaxID=412755 RepID=X1GCB9_9ZZZZ
MRESAVRVEVTKRWKAAGRPHWSYLATERVCLEVDCYFAELGKNPAPRFREEIERENDSYIRTWAMGCHFDWLNPR